MIDHSVIEVFTSTGQTLTLRFYPTGDADWRLVARVAGFGNAPFAVSVWELNPLAMTIAPIHVPRRVDEHRSKT